MTRSNQTLSLGLLLLGCGSRTTPPAPAALPSPTPAVATASSAALPSPSSPVALAEPAEPTAQRLAELVREPEWEPGTVVESFELAGKNGVLAVLIADFETIAKRSDGMPVGFRQIALFDHEKLLGKGTVKKSEGGEELVEREQRDLDGDGAPDWLVYYWVADQWNGVARGWVALLATGQVVHFPMTVELGPERQLLGNGCWAMIDGALVQLVVWGEVGFGARGERLLKGHRASAATVRDGTIVPLDVFGVRVATGADRSALLERVPVAHREPELESRILQPNCATQPPAFATTPEHGRWALLTGLALSRDSAGREWPEGFPKPARAQILRISNRDPSTWPAR